VNDTELLYLAAATTLLAAHPSLRRDASRRGSAHARAEARRRLWIAYLVVWWLVTGVGLVVWNAQGLDWDTLRLSPPRGWRSWASLGLVVVALVRPVHTVAAVARGRPPRRIPWQVPVMEQLAPRTGRELAVWAAVAVTAGVAEEAFFRGHLLAAATPGLGLPAAAGLSVVLFALGHAYQGVRGVLVTGAIGIHLTLVVLVLDSLWPAMALHAITNLTRGVLAWMAFRMTSPEPQGEALDGA